MSFTFFMRDLTETVTVRMKNARRNPLYSSLIHGKQEAGRSSVVGRFR